VAERIRQAVEQQPIPTEAGALEQTVSIGVATYPQDAATLEALIARADEALYAAKRGGRNRVMVA
jgi:diguanylate cyclase (GGDEF)-like protein